MEWRLKDESREFNTPDYSFNVANSYKRRSVHSSYKDIKLTFHSLDRAEQRLNIRSKVDLRKLASDAKNKGVNLNSIRQDTYEKIGLSVEEYQFLKKSFKPMNHSINLFLWKGCMFIFCGKGGNTLKTIINLRNKEDLESLNKNDLEKKLEEISYMEQYI